MRRRIMDRTTRRFLVTELRRNQTRLERKLWWLLRRKELAGYKFYRQFPIGRFVVDFCCRSKRLVIELDGSQHLDVQEYDHERTTYLEAEGYYVLRFWNNEMM